MKILVIIPAYNEEACIASTVNKLKKDAPECDYIVINDCSTDNTAAVLEKEGFNYIHLKSNLGIGGAVSTGYKYALYNDYDIAVQLDGDGQHDSAYLASVVKPIVDGEASIVIGSRFIKCEGFLSSAFRRAGITILNGWIRLFSGAKVTDCTSGYRAVSREYIRAYAKEYPIDYPEPEAIVLAKLNGATIKEVPVVMKERRTGKSSIRPIHSLYYMFKVMLSIFLCRLTHKKQRG